MLARETQGGGFGVFPRGDRRRRPLARLGAQTTRELESAGVLVRSNDDFVLSQAGRALVRRQLAEPGEQYVAQHLEIVARAVIDAEGALRPARGLDPNAVLRRLGDLRSSDGKPWLSGAELAAATELRDEWERRQGGQMRGSDWTAPPIGRAARGQSNAQEMQMARRCDSGRRVARALDALAPPLRRVVERICLHGEGLEALERLEGWPARSGKLALKLGLAQLAASLTSRA